MVSPDSTQYVDLRLFDRDAQDLFAAALVQLQTSLPDWTPREAQTEVLLLEALALIAEEDVFAINRVPSAVVEILLRLYQIDRDLGAPATVEVTFTLIDDAGYTIPAGTRIAIPVPTDPDTVIVFATDVAYAAPPGDFTVATNAVATTTGILLNDVAAGTPCELLDSLAVVESIATTTTIADGTDPETDVEWFTRGIQRFSRLTETLVLPRHFVAAALERTEVERAFAVDNYDPAGGPLPGDDPGHVTVAVYGNGAVLSGPQKTAIDDAFEEQCQANLAVHIADPTINDFEFNSCVVVGKVGYVNADVVDNVNAAIDTYLSPMTWEWGATVYKNEIIALLDGVDGVERVTVVDINAANVDGDLELTGVAPLVQYIETGAVTVTGI